MRNELLNALAKEIDLKLSEYVLKECEMLGLTRDYGENVMNHYLGVIPYLFDEQQLIIATPKKATSIKAGNIEFHLRDFIDTAIMAFVSLEPNDINQIPGNILNQIKLAIYIIYKIWQVAHKDFDGYTSVVLYVLHLKHAYTIPIKKKDLKFEVDRYCGAMNIQLADIDSTLAILEKCNVVVSQLEGIILKEYVYSNYFMPSIDDNI